MTPENVTLNLAYVLYVASTFAKSARWLRVALIITSVAFIAYGIVDSNISIIIWNALFGGSHLFAVTREYLAERRVKLPPELWEIRELLFPKLSVVDFLHLWALGHDEEKEPGDVMIALGEKHNSLMLVLEGEIHVLSKSAPVQIAPWASFLGEMRLLTGNPANADVVAQTNVRVHAWSHTELEALEILEPHLHSAMLSVLGRDLSAKIATRINSME